MLVDVHCHLDDGQFEKDRKEVLERNKEIIIVNNGLNVGSNRKVLALCSKNIYAALGMYPGDGIKLNSNEIEKEIEFIRKNKEKVIAIGEIGLDYLKVGEKDKQKIIFEKFLELASKIKKPVIVHSRGAEEEVVKILRNYDVDVVLHCFNGELGLTKKAFNYGFNFSIPLLIRKDRVFRTLVKEVDLKNILTETDSPYLGLGKRNEPKSVEEIVGSIALLKRVEKDFVENKIFENFSRIFLKEKGI